MSKEPKNMPTKKLRNGPVIEIDPQILRWRQKMRKLDIQLGDKMREAKRLRKAIREQRAYDGDITKKKWF